MCFYQSFDLFSRKRIELAFPHTGKLWVFLGPSVPLYQLNPVLIALLDLPVAFYCLTVFLSGILCLPRHLHHQFKNGHQELPVFGICHHLHLVIFSQAPAKGIAFLTKKNLQCCRLSQVFALTCWRRSCPPLESAFQRPLSKLSSFRNSRSYHFCLHQGHS